MADISKDELRSEINAILKDADLRVTSAKKVRQQLEEKLDCNLNSRKKEIDELVMNYVNSKEDEENDQSEEEEEDDDDEEENDKKKPAKRPAPKKSAPKAKKAKADSSEDGEESKDSAASEEEEFEAKKPIPKKKAPAKKKGKGSESDSDSDWGKTEKPKKAAAAGGRGKGGGYTRAYKLSPQLAALMGKDSMARHEVVKRVWAIIKEKNLYDPGNKQFAICDDELYKVMGVKRFRTFGMMKYLKSHFHD